MATAVSELGKSKPLENVHSPPRKIEAMPSWLTPENLRQARVIVREMNLNDPRETQAYIDALNDPNNRAHFSDPPTGIQALQAYAAQPGHHVLVAIAGVKDQQGKYRYVQVGGSGIEDAAPNQEDHFMVRVVIGRRYQERYGLGKKTVRGTINYAAANRASDGRIRNKLDVAIIREVSGWKNMRDTVLKMDPDRVGILRDQVNVPIPLKLGEVATVQRDVARYSFNLRVWRQITGIEPKPAQPTPVPAQ